MINNIIPRLIDAVAVGLIAFMAGSAIMSSQYKTMDDNNYIAHREFIVESILNLEELSCSTEMKIDGVDTVYMGDMTDYDKNLLLEKIREFRYNGNY